MNRLRFREYGMAEKDKAVTGAIEQSDTPDNA